MSINFQKCKIFLDMCSIEQLILHTVNVSFIILQVNKSAYGDILFVYMCLYVFLVSTV